MPKEYRPRYMRVSIGTLKQLGLTDLAMDAAPTTAYLLQYSREGCTARCRFCSQSRYNSVDKKYLSRITWPIVEFKRLLEVVYERQRLFKRLCIQTILKPGFIEELLSIIRSLREASIELPISVATTPIPRKYLVELRDLGVDYIGVGLDAASKEIFTLVSKPYTWDTYIGFIEDSVDVFGEKHVYVHLIIGLGENPIEALEIMETIYRIGGEVALFAYTPLTQWRRDKPSVEYYRLCQIVRYFLSRGYSLEEIVSIRNNKIYLESWVTDTIENNRLYPGIFLTSGCPDCNRPFYNESPRGPFYNYPLASMVLEHISKLREEINILRRGTRI